MSLTSFLEELFDEGCVEVPQCLTPGAAERDEAGPWLARFEARYRLALPGNPPALDLTAALEAAEVVYRLCQCLVYRDLDPREILPATAGNEKRGPAAHYGADISYRFLPDIWRLSRNAAPNDPLISCVMELATRWPLSSVGITGLPAVDVEGFVDEPSLRALYLDRIVQCGDRSRLDDPRIRRALREACGSYPELVSDLATAIEDSTGSSS